MAVHHAQARPLPRRDPTACSAVACLEGRAGLEVALVDHRRLVTLLHGDTDSDYPGRHVSPGGERRGPVPRADRRLGEEL